MDSFDIILIIIFIILTSSFLYEINSNIETTNEILIEMRNFQIIKGVE